jgi:hypothetical protein
MKRLVIFMLVGPAVGFSIFLLRQVFIGRFVGWEAVAFQLPIAYLFGLLPSLAMWFVDWLLFAKLRHGPRIAILAAVGYGASIAMLLIWSPVLLHLPQLLSFGIGGAVQAAVCAWLMSLGNADWQGPRSRSAAPHTRPSST